MKKPIVIYWSPGIPLEEEDASFLFNKPKTVFKDLLQYKDKNNSDENIFGCPAFSNKYKKMLTFTSPMSCEYVYDFSNGKDEIFSVHDHFMPLFKNTRPDMFTYGPNFRLNLGPLFFSEEPLVMTVTPPYFHKPGYTKYGTVVPGEFDIGQWCRPLSFEIQMWENSGTLEFTEGEPLFYVEFQTDRKIELRRFTYSPLLGRYVKGSTGTTNLFGKGKGLTKRYERFKNIGMREKVLTEIKKNLINETPFVF